MIPMSNCSEIVPHNLFYERLIENKRDALKRKVNHRKKAKYKVGKLNKMNNIKYLEVAIIDIESMLALSVDEIFNDSDTDRSNLNKMLHNFDCIEFVTLDCLLKSTPKCKTNGEYDLRQVENLRNKLDHEKFMKTTIVLRKRPLLVKPKSMHQLSNLENKSSPCVLKKSHSWISVSAKQNWNYILNCRSESNLYNQRVYTSGKTKRKKRSKFACENALNKSVSKENILNVSQSNDFSYEKGLPKRARWTIMLTAFLLFVMCLSLVGITLSMAPLVDQKISEQLSKLQQPHI